MKALDGVIIGFDLDNTLLDPPGVAYQNTVAKFMARRDLPLPISEALAAYEDLRAKGEALIRLGPRNPSHDRGNAEALAVLCLTRNVGSKVNLALGIDGDKAHGYGICLQQLAELDRRTHEGSTIERLTAELKVRAFCSSDSRAVSLRQEVKRVSLLPWIVEWAEQYAVIEREQPVEDLRPFLGELANRGATPAVISDGLSAVQSEKLDRLGLSPFFAGRVLISEAAASIPGIHELDRHLAELLNHQLSSKRSAYDPEIIMLWTFHCWIDAWRWKTASFYARCLHAIQKDPQRCEAALGQFTVIPQENWDPLRFVMVGDRYDRDVRQLIELLGPNAGMRIRLRSGKYAHLHSHDTLAPHWRPDRVFDDWPSLAAFLSSELTCESVPPITAAPPIVRPADFRADYIRAGLDSPLEAVRLVANVLARAHHGGDNLLPCGARVPSLPFSDTLQDR